MKPVLYVDVYFVLNFCMNWICLYLAAKLLSAPMKIMRFLLASSLGALGALGLLFVSRQYLVVLLHILLCILMCFAAVRHSGVLSFLRFCGLFFVFSLLVGGGLNALMNLAGAKDGELLDLLVYGILLFLILYLIWQISVGWIQKRLASRVTHVEVCYHGQRAMLSGLVDSGNLLREPMTGYPVILAKSISLAGILTEEMALTLQTGMPEGSVRVLAVPIYSGGANRMVFGFIPDALFISGGKKGRYEAKAVVALDDAGDSFAGCQCLVPLTLL